MIKGIDISHWNTQQQVKDALSTGDYKFCFMKATEGCGVRDAALSRHYSLCEKYKILPGFYHFAHPELNEPEQEAENFITTVHLYPTPALYALDLENKALEEPVEWARKWLDCVYNRTDIRPVVYIQSSAVRRFSSLAHGNYGLWVADYSDNKRLDLGDWRFWAFRQYTNKPYDQDVFNGELEKLMLYAKTEMDDTEKMCQCKCEACDLKECHLFRKVE